jgi:ArsR family transcriptional regulator
LLCEAGLLDRFPEGAWVFYRLAGTGAGGDLARSLLNLLPERDPVLDLDAQRLASIRSVRADKASSYFDAHAHKWDELNRSLIDRDGVEHALRKLITVYKPRELVDMGTGTGHILAVLADCIPQATGFDQSREMLAVARANLEQAGLTHCMVRQGDITQLPLPDGSVDCVVIHQVLHYMPEPAKVIAEAERILRPNGHLVVVDYAPHQEEFLRDQHAHRRLGFADSEVSGWLNAAGLSKDSPVTIPGPRLTVMIWTAHKSPSKDKA